MNDHVDLSNIHGLVIIQEMNGMRIQLLEKDLSYN
jgi:hypothetical protein